MNTKRFIFIYGFLILSIVGYSQGKDPEYYLKDTSDIRQMTELNRSKASINGIYIPSDIEDAVRRLSDISPERAIEKFKNEPEEGIDRKLHFGIGKWMIVNWYFYEGSRLEFYLRQMGLSHPDDMADFLIICFHRQLNGKNLETKKLADTYIARRRADLLKRKKIIDTSEIKGLRVSDKN